MSLSNVIPILKFYGYVTYYWVRSLIFRSRTGRAVERSIVTRRTKHQTMCGDGYISLATKILESLHDLSPMSFQESTVFEIGTGRHLAVPLMLRAMGIKRVITVDVAEGLILSQAKAMA